MLGLVTLALAASHAKLLRGNEAPFAAALVVASLGYAAAYFLQLKGWAYHAIPLVGCASLALAALLAESSRPAEDRPPDCAGTPVAAAVSRGRRCATHRTAPSADLAGAIAGLHAGDTIGFVTTETAIPWSVTLQGRYRYASRYNGFWMMPAVAANERAAEPDPRLARARPSDRRRYGRGFHLLSAQADHRLAFARRAQRLRSSSPSSFAIRASRCFSRIIGCAAARPWRLTSSCPRSLPPIGPLPQGHLTNPSQG